MSTGEIIKMLREKKGITQDDLAKAAGYKDRSSIAKIESGGSDPSQRMLLKIANVLEVSPAELLDEVSSGTYTVKGDTNIVAFREPKTPENRIVSANMDDLPQDDREVLLSVFMAMMRKRHPERFEKGDLNET